MTNSLPMKTRAMMYEQQLDHLPRLVDEMYRRIENTRPEALCGHRARQRHDGRGTSGSRASSRDDGVPESALAQ